MTSRNVMNKGWYRFVGIRGSNNLFPDQPFPPSPTTSTTTTDTTSQGKQIEFQHRPSNFGKVYASPWEEVAKHRLVFLGEIHSTSSIISFQRQVQLSMKEQTKGELHVILEHFSFDLQHLLDDYIIHDKLSFDEMVEKYHQVGHEGHDLEPYRELLEDARKIPGIVVHAGFLPRPYARMLVKEGIEQVIKTAPSGWLPPVDKENINDKNNNGSSNAYYQDLVQGTEFHYNIFESLISGRPIYDSTSTLASSKPTDQFRRIFPAQILKDVAMSNKINALLNDDIRKENKFLIIAGNGHLIHYCGVPERVLEQQHPNILSETCLVVSASTSEKIPTSFSGRKNVPDEPLTVGNDEKSNADTKNDKSDDNDTVDGDLDNNEKEFLLSLMHERFGPEGTNPADYAYFYQLPEEVYDEEYERIMTEKNSSTTSQHDSSASAAAAVKEETRTAYDKVGESAGLPGNYSKAVWIMNSMGYTQEQINIAGLEAYNFQGVGNPHLHANIQPGDVVLDVGSGLGIDSFIAYDAVRSTSDASAPSSPTTGKVIGIDISEKQVQHARKSAVKRGLTTATATATTTTTKASDTDSDDDVVIGTEVEDHNIRFVVADMDSIPLPNESVDVVISNGAFCLAPDKEKSFREIYRVLKPGGRISICTTTVKKRYGRASTSSIDTGTGNDNDDDKKEKTLDEESELSLSSSSWPICMQMFILQHEIKPLCEAIGFHKILIDDTDSTMTMEIPEEILYNDTTATTTTSSNRHKIHVGNRSDGSDFKHLERYDMDELCARVCIVAHKPPNKQVK